MNIELTKTIVEFIIDIIFQSGSVLKNLIINIISLLIGDNLLIKLNFPN